MNAKSIEQSQFLFNIANQSYRKNNPHHLKLMDIASKANFEYKENLENIICRFLNNYSFNYYLLDYLKKIGEAKDRDYAQALTTVSFCDYQDEGKEKYIDLIEHAKTGKQALALADYLDFASEMGFYNNLYYFNEDLNAIKTAQTPEEAERLSKYASDFSSLNSKDHRKHMGTYLTHKKLVADIPAAELSGEYQIVEKPFMEVLKLYGIDQATEIVEIAETLGYSKITDDCMIPMLVLKKEEVRKTGKPKGKAKVLKN